MFHSETKTKNGMMNFMKIIYTFLIPFFIGIILTVFCYQAYTIYELRAEVATDHSTLSSVVNYLNSAIQQNQQAQTAQTANAPQQTPTSSRK